MGAALPYYTAFSLAPVLVLNEATTAKNDTLRVRTQPDKVA